MIVLVTLFLTVRTKKLKVETIVMRKKMSWKVGRMGRSGKHLTHETV